MITHTLPVLPVEAPATVVVMTPPSTEPFANTLQFFDLNTTSTTLSDGSS